MLIEESLLCVASANRRDIKEKGKMNVNEEQKNRFFTTVAVIRISKNDESFMLGLKQ